MPTLHKDPSASADQVWYGHTAGAALELIAWVQSQWDIYFLTTNMRPWHSKALEPQKWKYNACVVGFVVADLGLVTEFLNIVVEKAADSNYQRVDIQRREVQEPALSLVHNIAQFGFRGVFDTWRPGIVCIENGLFIVI